ncbi:hypothetical protein GCM10010272_58900 [Streptomyces lateritius]|nr:hypothetical protein GCM10010272_58900 [Streptomyces lateritius]
MADRDPSTKAGRPRGGAPPVDQPGGGFQAVSVKSRPARDEYESDPPPCDRTPQRPQALPCGQTALLAGHDLVT